MNISETSNINKDAGTDSLALNSLERIRQRLVDTSARNRLINCRQDRAQVIRLVDELPDQVYQRLAEGKPFELEAVPSPTHQELLDEGYIEFDEETGECTKDTYPKPDTWARRYNINTDYDLPSGLSDDINPSHTDSKLQTLLFPEMLNTRLNKLRQLAQTAMEESGTNILYLALGFLEWYESSSSDTPRLSPLFVVPVDLSRGKGLSSDGLRTYKISLRDDGLLNNVSLSQRMVQDFGLDMPEITDDSQPESYFDAVRRIIERKDSRWKVRRYASLCLLDFTKQLMYEDLDPARWPANSNLTDHPLLQQFLSAGDNANENSTGTNLSEHLIDQVPNVHDEFPLIYEADSSQHSALIDVVNGDNLVIEGPPGTGKSQTITNLIAACINKGLSVLFVAEKLAALEVVKRRLDAADLGDFCLEVHSHKSSKLAILESLMDSLKRRENVTPPAGLKQQINRYEEHKNTLHDYAEKLNLPWKDTGLTPHQILQRATDFGERSPLSAGESVVKVSDVEKLSAAFISDTLETAERLQIVFDAVASQTPDATIDTHPWFGVCNGNISGPQRDALIQLLKHWAEQQQLIMNRWSELQDTLHIDPVDTPDQDTLVSLMGTLNALPEDTPEALLARVEELRDNSQILDALATERKALRQRLTESAAHFSAKALLNPDHATATAEALQGLRDKLGLTGTAPLDMAMAHPGQIDVLRTRLLSLQEQSAALQGALPDAFDNVFELSVNGMESLCELLDIAADLPTKLWRYRDDRYREREFAIALDELEPQILSLRDQHDALADVFVMEHLPDSRTLEDIGRIMANGGLFGFLKSDYRTARQSLKAIARPGTKTAHARDNLASLARFQKGLEDLIASHHRNPVLGTAFQSLKTNLALHRKMAQWYQTVASSYGQHSLRLSPQAEALFTLDDASASLLARAAESDLRDQADKQLSSLAKLRAIYPQYFSDFSADSHLLDSDAGLSGLIQQIEDYLASPGQTVLDSSLPLSELIDSATRWSNTARDHQAWITSEGYSLFVPSLFSLSAHPDEDDSRACATLASAQYLSSLAAASPLFCKAMQQEPSLAQLDRIRTARPALLDALQESAAAQEAFEMQGDVERSLWQMNCRQMAQSHSRNTRALEKPDWLDTWLSYQRVKQRPDMEGLSRLMDKLEDGSLPSDQTKLAIEADLYQHLALHLMSHDQDLANMDGNLIQAVRQQFQQYDKALLGLQRQQIAANCCRSEIPAGNNQGPVGTHTELSLIRREASKKRAHVAIRSLLKRSSTAIQALKPCFMMSPMSVAQYLEPGQYEFDVIVMDEASQIRPEEALGAIARARQLVVVGDPKQLPPTSFFSRMASDGDDDDEDVGLQQAESILDAVIPVFPTRRLRWHYRSRHESLIAFSNQKFYDSDLVLFPSPFNQSEEFGINFTRLEDATFNDNVNMKEAERIVDLLAVQLQERPHESVGVVAMNIKQRDQIEAQWERRLTSDGLLQRAYERSQSTDEPVFFKNLENVQGDERDVIIISMTYGPEIAGGITYQRFGPINSDVGWRRLNVLLTRSKKRMEIVSSMGSGDVRLDSGKKQGVRSLRELLEYCETGHLQSTVDTGKAPDSAFEIAVMRKLAAAGYESVPQVGVAGFFIDLAVRNPDKPGEFLMGIECDGATYHSAKSARDRDRLRQEVLEGLGWKIRRIWSTDWFRNADAQIQPIVAELARLRQERIATSETADSVVAP